MKKGIFSRKVRSGNGKSLLKNKLGMTYVELITALGLLALIITSFTPMLLSSYETLYDAGVKVQEVYNSKEEMEEGLARRDSEKSASVQLDLKVNADAVFNNMNISGRKIISTFREGLETVFGQVRPRIEIVSPSTVYDDATSHNIILQTFGLEYKKITFGAFNYDTTNNATASNKMPADQIHIQVIAPNKSAKKTDGTSDENMIGTDDGLVYGSGRFCELEYFSSKFTSKNIPSDGLEISNDDNAGRIKLKIKSPATGDKLDFTYSPLKIQVYYINSRGHLKTVSEYLYIDPATIIAAGETAPGIDYYTSAGIEAINISEDDDEKLIEYQLKAEARTMRTSNSVYLNNAGQRDVAAIGAPSKQVSGQTNTEIRSIRWIDNDETHGLNPYYVMTGTNGSIYRMYTFNSDKSDIFDEAMGATIKNTTTGFFSSTQNYIDRVYTTTTGRRVYPALWGGDYSHIFEYTSAEKRVAYGSSVNFDNDQAWVTSAKENGLERAGLSGDPAYNIMSANAQFCYYYNGAGTGHTFAYKDARPISYVLTERGWPIRLTGVIGSPTKVTGKDFFIDFTALWDKDRTTTAIRTSTVYQNSAEVLAFHYENENQEQQADDVFGGLRIKFLASYPVNKDMRDNNQDYFDGADDYENTTSMAKLKNVQKTSEDLINGYGNDVNVTDVIYIPSTDSTQGSTFYVGNVHAYANVLQNVKREAGAAKHNEYTNIIGQKKDTIISDNGMVGRWYQNRSTFYDGNACSYPIGSITDYLIISNPTGTSTYIVKRNDNDYSRNAEWEGSYTGDIYNAGDPSGRGYQFCFANDYINSLDHLINNATASSYGLVAGDTVAKRTEFFLPKNGGYWEYMYLSDVSFTFGFASNRERVYTNITYDGQVEYTRSFERLYWRSHYGQDAVYYNENGECTFAGTNANQSAYTGVALGIHQQNRATSNGSGALVKTATVNNQPNYLNHVDNDYYNVWFPGEMYNLNKIASKDGVTVAVGYAVAGSSYQHAMANDSSVTSTGLGSVYNDGVLAAMIEGKDDAFVNLLYYKDNESFDNYSLYDPTSADNGTDYAQYADYGDFKYGMHGRDSVQFTAVDLIVENKKSSETATDYTVDYYAYYGDNKGRVFRSLVASASGSSSSEGEMNAAEAGASLVPYITDTPTSIESRSTAPSQMVEITIGGKGLDQYFKNIGTIDAMDDLVIITGEMASGGEEYIVVGVRNPDTDVWTYRAVRNCGFTSVINDAAIVGGYYYIVGDGWMAGVMLDVLRDTSVTTLSTPSLTNENIGCKSKDPNQLLWCNTDVDLYAIAGRDTH